MNFAFTFIFKFKLFYYLNKNLNKNIFITDSKYKKCYFSNKVIFNIYIYFLYFNNVIKNKKFIFYSYIKLCESYLNRIYLQKKNNVKILNFFIKRNSFLTKKIITCVACLNKKFIIFVKLKSFYTKNEKINIVHPIFFKINNNLNINVWYFFMNKIKIKVLFYEAFFNKNSIKKGFDRDSFIFFGILILSKMLKIKLIKVTFFDYKHSFHICVKKINNMIRLNNYQDNYKFVWKKLEVKNVLMNFIYSSDFDLVKKNYNIFSNNYLLNFFSMFDYKFNRKNSLSKKLVFYNFNNYYPALILKKEQYDVFFNDFKQVYNMNHALLLNKIFINFFENFLKKKIFLKVDNNFFNKIKNSSFFNLSESYKNFQPIYFKNFFFQDFLEIIWYSLLLKDLSILSEWVSIFMEKLNFKNHRKFVILFQNIITKNYNIFSNVLKIKGFFFDIRGKVGVTGSSKKRHLCFRLGSLKKSSKKTKINFNQSLVRTYSGVMGLTYIIAF